MRVSNKHFPCLRDPHFLNIKKLKCNIKLLINNKWDSFKKLVWNVGLEGLSVN